MRSLWRLPEKTRVMEDEEVAVTRMYDREGRCERSNIHRERERSIGGGNRYLAEPYIRVP